MNVLKQLISYLINPRSRSWKFAGTNQHPTIQPRKLHLKAILNPPIILGGIILITLVVIAWFGPAFASYDPYLTSRSVPTYFDRANEVLIRPPFDPSPDYPLGTDRFGNDLVSLLLYGTRVTLVSCLYITAGRVFLGLVLGGISGWSEGSWFDRLVNRLSAVITSIPILLSSMLMILALDMQKGVWVFVVSLTAVGWTEIAQSVRREFIRIKGLLYIEAAEAIGMTRLQVMVTHALPNVFSYLLSMSFLEMGAVLLLIAELGFLHVYIGGASRYRYSNMIFHITKTPEWGALVAHGTAYLRAHPYLALGPASAFFIAIVGFNAFGDGLRRIFERWPFSTAFLLKKQMLLFLTGFILLTLFIFQKTSPSVSYQKAAESFQEENALSIYEELKSQNVIARESGSNPLESYLHGKLYEYALKPGYSEVVISSYSFPAETTVIKPVFDPVLRTENESGYLFQEDFAFLSDGCAGGGSGSGQLLLFSGDIDDLSNNQQVDLEGRILLTFQEDYQSQVALTGAQQGIEGILVVAEDQFPLQSQFEADPESAEALCPVEEIPVYRITDLAARRIAQQGQLDWGELKQLAQEEDQPIQLDLWIEMELQLSAPRTVPIPNAIGFSGGFDIDTAYELVVVYTTFDGLGLSQFDQEGVPEDDLAKIALLLEILHTWEENNLDLRRSVLFVFWGGEGADSLDDDLISGIFDKNRLSPRVRTSPVKPALWVEINDLSLTSAQLAYADESSDLLVNIIKKGARAVGLQLKKEILTGDVVEVELPKIYLSETADPALSPTLDLAKYTQKGIAINRLLIQLLRSTRY